jgi:hypothetical protein
MSKTKPRLIPFVVKMDSRLRQLLQDRANAHTNGNVSDWLRLAGVKYDPPKKDKNKDVTITSDLPGVVVRNRRSSPY